MMRILLAFGLLALTLPMLHACERAGDEARRLFLDQHDAKDAKRAHGDHEEVAQ